MPQFLGGEGERRAQHAPEHAAYTLQADKPEDVDILTAGFIFFQYFFLANIDISKRDSFDV